MHFHKENVRGVVTRESWAVVGPDVRVRLEIPIRLFRVIKRRSAIKRLSFRYLEEAVCSSVQLHFDSFYPRIRGALTRKKS